MIFTGCKKESTTEEAKPTQETNQGYEKLMAWMDKKIELAEDSLKQKLSALKSSVTVQNIHFEDYRNGEQLIVAKLNASFISKNNAGKAPQNFLVAVLPVEGNITKGNIVQYISATAGKPLANNNFSKIFNYQKIEGSGQFTVLSVTDYFRYELKFKDGKLFSVAEPGKKQKSTPTGKVNECIEWYLQTWTVWADGTMELISETYIGTTCDDDCSLAKAVNGKSFRVGCSGSNGGGNIEYEYEVSRESVSWTVASNPVYGPSGGEIKSLEKIKGKKVAGEPGGGHFTQISHNSSGCNFCNSYSNPNNVWSEGTWSGSYSGQLASCSISGTLDYEGERYPIANSKSWTFQELF